MSQRDIGILLRHLLTAALCCVGCVHKHGQARAIMLTGLVLLPEPHNSQGWGLLGYRYWIADTYEARHAEGKEPESIDKEFLRLWFRERCDPYKDKVRTAALRLDFQETCNLVISISTLRPHMCLVPACAVCQMQLCSQASMYAAHQGLTNMHLNEL